MKTIKSSHDFCSDYMETPLVSIIIPNYNHARFLDSRIQSVLNQTYDNFEIIILDDKSIDNSVEVIRKYANNPHVSHIIVNETNSGVPFVQWHKGFEMSKGDLIWIAESDDMADMHFLEKMVPCFLADNNCVLAFARSMIIDSNGNSKYLFEGQQKDNIRVDYSGETFIKEKMKWANYIGNASSALFRKEVLNIVSDDYMSFRGCGDWLFWIYISEIGNVTYIPDILNFFRMHDFNTTSRLAKSAINDIEQRRIVDYLKKKGFYSFKDIVMMKVDLCEYHRSVCPFSNVEAQKTFERVWRINCIIYMLMYFRNLIHRIKWKKIQRI